MKELYLVMLLLGLLLSLFGWLRGLVLINSLLAVIIVYIFSIFIGFRSESSGVDTASYLNYFNSLKKNENTNFSFEIGFEYFSYYLSQITTGDIYIFLLSFIQLMFITLSAKNLNIKNIIIVPILYLSFLPGLDMLTNGIRGGSAIAIGLPLLMITVIKRNRLAPLNFLPMLFHASYGIISLISLFTNSFSSVRNNKIIFIASILFFCTWLIIEPYFILEKVNFLSGSFSVFGKLVRYLLIEKELMSSSVKLYFILLSLSFSFFYFYIINSCTKAKQDILLNKLAFITLVGQLVYAFVSFGEYSYRFMFLVYPLQIILTAYILDNYVSGLRRLFFLILFVLTGSVITYSSNTFQSFELLNL